MGEAKIEGIIDKGITKVEVLSIKFEYSDSL